MEQKQNINFETLMSLDIRVCKVIEAERIPKTDKLLKLKINTGIDERYSITNLGERYTPDDFLNKKISFILNLEPKIIRGIETSAMLFIPKVEDNIFTHYTNYEIGEIIFN